MADDHTDRPLSRRRILASLATIGASLSAAGVGTWALFADRERGDLAVRAGTVTLSAGGGSDPTITVDDIEAGGSGSERLGLTNSGSLDAGIVVCVDGVSVQEGDSADTETDAGSEDSPIRTVEFKGCGQARVLLGRKPDSPVSVRFEHGDGSRTVEIGPSALKKNGDGWRYTHKRTDGKNDYVERVVAGGRSWVNDDCKHVADLTGDSAVRSEAEGDDLAENVLLSIGVDPGDGSAETLIEETTVASLPESCHEASTTLGPGDSTDLVLGWEADPTDGLTGEITIDLTVTLQS